MADVPINLVQNLRIQIFCSTFAPEMKDRIRKILIFAGMLACASCANRGVGPQGGPKDVTPPVPVRAIPENGSTGFTGDKIEVLFNEYLQLDNVSQNLLMSPPQQTPPDVKARGKRLLVRLADTLRENTTYTIDFGNAVCDYTEKNPLRGYSFAFSTGDVIDTMEIGGQVFDASNLNPVGGVFVGIHENMADSAFTSTTFLRVARTDSAGHFRIGNMHEGTYRLYAVDDISRDYRLTPGEALAYADETVTPFVRPHIHDTHEELRADSLSLQEDSTSVVMDSTAAGGDSVHAEQLYEYGPADLVLFLFREQQQRLYLQRTLREKQHAIQVLFSSSPDSLPVFRPLRPSDADTAATAAADSAWVDPTPYILTHFSAKGDTATLWLTDSAAMKIDTLYLEARYRRTDSLYHLEWATDTIRAVWRAPRLSAKAKEAQERQRRNRKLELKSNARQAFELYDTLTVTCSTPLSEVIRDSIHLFHRVDSVLTPVPFELRSSAMSFSVIASLTPGERYELNIDSAALHDVYGVANLFAGYKLQLKTPEDYSTLRVRITPYVPQARIQVLNNKDEVLRELPADPAGAFFEYLKADSYYLRLYMDEDGDGKWTTGSWEEKRQPEAVYYFSEKIQTKSNWDFEEEWDYLSTPQLEAKPIELIKASAGKKK